MSEIDTPAERRSRSQDVGTGLLLLLFLAAVAAGGLAATGMELGTRDIRWLNERLLIALVIVAGVGFVGGGVLALRGKKESRYALLLFLAFGIFAVTLGVVMYRARDLRETLVEQEIGHQEDVALLKGQMAQKWLFERTLSPNQLASSLRQLDHDVDTLTREEKQVMSVLFTEYLAGNPERTAASLYGPDAQVAFHLGNNEQPQPDEIEAVRSFVGREPRFVELKGNDKNGTRGRLAYIRPVVANAKPAMLVVVFDPWTLFYRQLDEWPPDTHTSECLIVRRDGSKLVYVKPPPGLKAPVSDDWLQSLQGVIGGDSGVVQDYRGKTVLAAAHPLKGLPWFVVVKTDRAEILEPLKKDFGKTILVVAGFIAVGGVLMFFLLWATRRTG
jgi:hypothetical protein